MDTQAALAALDCGDMYALANSLEWDEYRRVQITPPSSVSDMFVDGSPTKVDRAVYRRGRMVFTVKADECVGHASLEIHGPYETEERAHGAAVGTFTPLTNAILSHMESIGAQVADSGWVLGARNVTVPDTVPDNWQ
jgi:hypothetical protein